MLITASGGARGKKQVLLKQIADKGVKLAAEGGFKVTTALSMSPRKGYSSFIWYMNWSRVLTHTYCQSARLTIHRCSSLIPAQGCSHDRDQRVAAGPECAGG